MYFVRFFDPKKNVWKRSRTIRGPRGLFKTIAGATKRVELLRSRGLQAHIVVLDMYPNKTHYSKNFSRNELDCKCGCDTPAKIEKELTKLARDLELIRIELGTRVGILSGYRCPAHNKAVGGASKSMHMSGKAADLAVPRGCQDKFVSAAERVPSFRNGGIGVYPAGGVHVDRRGYIARWTSY